MATFPIQILQNHNIAIKLLVFLFSCDIYLKFLMKRRVLINIPPRWLLGIGSAHPHVTLVDPALGQQPETPGGAIVEPAQDGIMPCHSYSYSYSYSSSSSSSNHHHLLLHHHHDDYCLIGKDW